eukprot:scaffold153567_cov39-Tisochrysis_lutea.AAC.2
MTGLDMAHPRFRGSVVNGWPFEICKGLLDRHCRRRHSSGASRLRYAPLTCPITPRSSLPHARLRGSVYSEDIVAIHSNRWHAKGNATRGDAIRLVLVVGMRGDRVTAQSVGAWIASTGRGGPQTELVSESKACAQRVEVRAL